NKGNRAIDNITSREELIQLYIKVERDSQGRLTHLFFAHPISLELSRKYPEVLVMDCTTRPININYHFFIPLALLLGIQPLRQVTASLCMRRQRTTSGH